MDTQKIPRSPLYNAATGCLCMLLMFCFCLPAQSQLIKIPFLGGVCIAGVISIIHSRGKVLSRQTWVWMSLYLLYNIIWSAFGFINSQPAVSNYFRLGVIWPILFLLIVAVIDRERIKLIDKTIVCILIFQVVCVCLMMGYAFQWWPNVIEWLIPSSRVGIHKGYIHVTGHFIGALAFTMPYVYCRFVLNSRQKNFTNVMCTVFWFVAIMAMVATNRRILAVVLAACLFATIIATVLRKETRRRIAMSSVLGLVITLCFMWVSATLTSNMATDFLEKNYDEIYEVVFLHEHDEEGTIKYVKGIVFDLAGITKNDEMQVPPVNKPSDGSDSLKAFSDRFSETSDELRVGSVRGDIIKYALAAWRTSPLIGVGFGAEIPGLEKEVNKGTYEMEFVVRLFTTGVIGLSVLLGLMLYIGLMGIKQMTKSYEILRTIAPCIVAYLGATVATLSNPYIFSGFDYLFMLFLPVAYLNVAIKENDAANTHLV